MIVSTKVLAACAMVLLMVGCNSIGPRSIGSGRAAYAEVINRTENEQILLSIIKGRYGESSTLLQVNAIAANIRFRADAGLEVGFNGPVDSPGDNLVTGGLAYEENPTITYVPVQGEKYLKQLMKPVPLDLLVLIVHSSVNSKAVFNLLVNRVNDLRNPVFMEGSLDEPDPGFDQFVALFCRLQREGILELAGSNEDDGAFAVLLRTDRKYEDERAEVVSLLGLSVPQGSSEEDLVLPLNMAIQREPSWSMAVSTRSTFSLVELMNACVEVPEEHRAAGWAVDFPLLALSGEALKIQSSKTRPDHASIAVYYRGYWFFIDDADHETKLAFNLLRSLWSIAISSGSDGHGSVPVLTIPVSQ